MDQHIDTGLPDQSLGKWPVTLTSRSGEQKNNLPAVVQLSRHLEDSVSDSWANWCTRRRLKLVDSDDLMIDQEPELRQLLRYWQ